VEENTMAQVSVWIAVIVFGVLTLALGAMVLRFGPRRGYWNQPAAVLRPVRSWLRISMWSIGAVHVVVGIGVAIAVPGAGFAIVAVCAGMGGIYVLFGEAWAAGKRIAQRTPASPLHGMA
jgi:hypothetical protein